MFAFVLCALLVAADPQKLDAVAPHAAGVALAEVVKVEEFDDRPMDGNKGVRFKLKLVRGTGEFEDTVTVVTAFGGLRPPGSKPKPSAPVRPESLEKGKRYWFAFSSRHQYEEYNQGVICFWPDTDAKVAEVMEAAVKNDLLKWHPQYDPQTELTYGRTVGEKSWKVRVEKAGKVLWEKELPGGPQDGYSSWGLWDNTGNSFPSTFPPCGKLLIAESKSKLDAGNEYGLAAGPYHVNTGFDPETGKRYAAWVSLPQVSSVELLHREYDPESGKPRREDRFDWPQTGGKAAGAKTENWYRKVSRLFDPATGKVTKEEVFRHDQDAEFDKRWVKVGK